LLIFIAILLGIAFYNIFLKEKRIFAIDENYSRQVFLNDNGIFYNLETTQKTVEEFLTENKIALGEHDQVLPEKNSPLVSGENILIQRAVKIKIEVDGKTIENYSLAKNVREAILENKITIGRLDKAKPDFDSLPHEGIEIILTRINVEEKIIPEEIDFKTTVKTDSKMGWREKKVEQKGKKGILEVKYKITYKNGKEISREILEKNIIKEPVSEIITKGTYIKLGKTHTGLGTWYKQPSHLFIGSESGEGMYAANPWLPKGSYVKVTNKANGKSVIVRINDRGPFGENRIIDLHSVAFQKIASLGAGVIDVKMEEILN